MIQGVKGLCNHLGCTPDVLRTLIAAGLPVTIIGGAGTTSARYRADASAISDWFKTQHIVP
jgi:Rieske Fe-S protein